MFFDKDERRVFARMQVDCDITFRYGNNSRVLAGTGKNLSGNGILFTTREPLKVGSELDLNVVPGLGNVTPPLNAIVKVVHVTPSTKLDSYTVGGTFSKIL